MTDFQTYQPPTQAEGGAPPLPPRTQFETQETEEVESTEGIETTLDEPVYVTLWRELRQVFVKLFHVVVFCTKTERVLKDWDLWGPMFVCYLLALLLSINSMIANKGSDDDSYTSYVFSIVFISFWVGSFFISLNTKFLGGKLSTAQSVCIVGYCVFPIFLGAIVTTVCTLSWKVLSIYVGVPVMILCCIWSCMASFGFLQSAIELKRRPLAVYPIILFFAMLSWLTLVVNISTYTSKPDESAAPKA
ncbi:protein YIPF6, putative [Entamoeba invadens IP1]|uniref:Protein YIPF n=2 Tax=Entamoeba invadens TaxID=33085 RepID=A0A0A1UDQ7_ENTIV|nr:protein YIPF6, putative [Entamoeba invadens IP1]ELP94476.1 protein YIPF6, putative [Entamoeba invadens IP1]BAN42236.1 protein YIPF6, putative [Entamoeba invadens]|eukprot:XP_004261247.1 protein YIPF6, putative [Entamoeba invadens IP1]